MIVVVGHVMVVFLKSIRELVLWMFLGVMIVIEKMKCDTNFNLIILIYFFQYFFFLFDSSIKFDFFKNFFYFLKVVNSVN